jgi:hypothetical protein
MVAKWTKAQENRLLDLAEKHDRVEIAAALGCKVKTVANRLCRLKTRAKSDLLTLAECTRRTGYLKHQLHRARLGLNQRWKKQPNRGSSCGISEEQLDAMCEWLRLEK